MIENADIYKTNPEFVRGIIKMIAEDQKNKTTAEQSRIELEKIKLAQLEKEIDFQKLELQSAAEISDRVVITDSEPAPQSLENNIRSIKTLTIAIPPEALHLFFQSLEKAFVNKNVPDGLKSEVLINLLGYKCNHVLTYVTEQEIANYDKIKA